MASGVAIVAWAGHLFAAVEEIFGVFGMIPILILVSKKKPPPTQCTSLLCTES